MGKSPAKWLKSILLGRKPSNYKSNLSKRREPSCNVQINANKEELVPASGLIMEPALIPLPAGGLSSTTNIVQLSLGKGECLDAADDEDHFQLVKHDGDSTTTTLGSPGDPDRKILEQAVTKTQAMYRGYLARRAFRALKGIIRLQALIRGHLVRRQAVATLFCTIAVVKVQRAVRGQKLQYSDFGIVVHGRSNLKKHLNSQHLHSFRISASCRSKNLSTNGVIHKLLAPSPIMMPLCLQYDQREPNSAFVWLERWTKSCFWKGNMQTNDIVDMKSHTRVDSSQALETEDSQSKHFVHKSPLTVENGSVISVAESKKSKADLSKASRLAVPVHEPQPNEIEKVKRNLRKTSSSSIKTSDHKEADAEKLMHALKKSSSSASPDVPPLVVADSTEKKIGVTALVPPPVDTESCSKLISDAVIEQVDGLKDDTGLELKAKETDARIDDMVAMDYEQETKDEPSNFVNQITENKASLATKRDSLENRSRDSPRIPSYMASTKSAKAKFRGQSSPKLASDEIEKSSATRRYSLPASIHRKSNSVTPQVQKVAQNGKRGSRSEKSVSSSKEAGDKVSLPEWKR